MRQYCDKHVYRRSSHLQLSMFEIIPAKNRPINQVDLEMINLHGQADQLNSL